MLSTIFEFAPEFLQLCCKKDSGFLVKLKVLIMMDRNFTLPNIFKRLETTTTKKDSTNRVHFIHLITLTPVT